MRARVVLAVAPLLLASSARAESPRSGSFELGAGTYYPNIDSGKFQYPDGTAAPGPVYSDGTPAPGPYHQMFGNNRGWMFRAGVSRALFLYPGSFEIGFKTGFFRRTGYSLSVNTDGSISNTLSADKTTFNIIPTSATLTYRFDLLADRYRVPLAPYARVALDRYNWWIGKQTGGSAKSGATNGWSWTAGIALQLDFFDPDLARELDMDTGINHTYLFFDVTRSYVDDFGSSRSFDLSNRSVSYGGGILFVF